MIWKEIKDFPYSVSSTGLVRNNLTELILKGSKNQKGYLMVDLKYRGRRKNITVHTLVALNFIGERPDGFQINHIDGIKTNNSVENLEYVTPSENCIHALKSGLVPNRKYSGKPRNQNLTRLEKNLKISKLTELDVVEIKICLKASLISQKELAKIFNISPAIISEIKTGKIWNTI